MTLIKAEETTLDFIDVSQFQSVAQDMLAKAKAKGATQADVALSAATGLSVNVRMGEVEHIEFNRDKGLGIMVYFGQRRGNASTSDFSPAAVEAAVEKACCIAKLTEEDPFAGLADAEKLSKEFPDLDLYHPWGITPEDASSLALTCETAARDFDARISNSDGATVSSQQSYGIYANSHGFMGGYPTSRQSISCVVIAKDEQGGMQRDYYYSAARASDGLISAARVGEEAASRTVRRLNAKRIPTCQVPVLMTPEVSKTLWSHLISAISGGNLYRQSSFLIDHVGKLVLPSHISLREDPFVKRGLASTPYDSEGVAVQARDIVADGILQGYVLGSYSARKLGLETTGNAGGVHNVFVSHSESSFDDLVKEMDKGLIVAEVMGQGVNITTGDYSRGVSGFWVENGQIQFPVEEITIAGNLKHMLQNIVKVGNDIDKRSGLFTGSVLIQEMTIAGE